MSSKDYNPFINHIVAPFFRQRIKTVVGIKNFYKKNPCIFAINHTVSFDHAVFASFLKNLVNKKIYFPTKHTYYDFYNRFKSADMLGMIRVDPEMPGHCLQALLKKIKQGHCIGIFPEGTGHAGRELIRGKTGVARLAIWSRSQVVPIGMNGGEYGKRIIDWIRIFLDRRKNIAINIGKPLSFEEYYGKPLTYECLRAVTDRIMRKIGELCGKLYPY